MDGVDIQNIIHVGHTVGVTPTKLFPVTLEVDRLVHPPATSDVIKFRGSPPWRTCYIQTVLPCYGIILSLDPKNQTYPRIQWTTLQKAVGDLTYTIETFLEVPEVLDQSDIYFYPSSRSVWPYEQFGWQINIMVDPGYVLTVIIIVPTINLLVWSTWVLNMTHFRYHTLKWSR